MLCTEGDSTRIDFLHEGVPDNETKDIAQGWKDYYLGPLKEYVEKKTGLPVRHVTAAVSGPKAAAVSGASP